MIEKTRTRLQRQDKTLKYYFRIYGLFINFSSAFNTIIPTTLAVKLMDLGPPSVPGTKELVMDFGRKQQRNYTPLRIGNGNLVE